MGLIHIQMPLEIAQGFRYFLVWNIYDDMMDLPLLMTMTQENLDAFKSPLHQGYIAQVAKTRDRVRQNRILQSNEMADDFDFHMARFAICNGFEPIALSCDLDIATYLVEKLNAAAGTKLSLKDVIVHDRGLDEMSKGEIHVDPYKRR